MSNFIAEYWLEFLFGIIATILGAACKYVYSLYKKVKESKQSEQNARIENLIHTVDENNESRIKNLNSDFQNSLKDLKEWVEKSDAAQNKEMAIIKDGVLAVQKETYMSHGQELLNEQHHITTEEYLTVTKEHDIYNRLGGNHEGDLMFDAITVKYHKGLEN